MADPSVGQATSPTEYPARGQRSGTFSRVLYAHAWHSASTKETGPASLHHGVLPKEPRRARNNATTEKEDPSNQISASRRREGREP
jgi:hypothetical protein